MSINVCHARVPAIFTTCLFVAADTIHQEGSEAHQHEKSQSNSKKVSTYSCDAYSLLQSTQNTIQQHQNERKAQFIRLFLHPEHTARSHHPPSSFPIPISLYIGIDTIISQQRRHRACFRIAIRSSLDDSVSTLNNLYTGREKLTMTTWNADLVSPEFVVFALVGGRAQRVHLMFVIAVGFAKS